MFSVTSPRKAGPLAMPGIHLHSKQRAWWLDREGSNASLRLFRV